jgi:hypothetical protein
MSAFASQAMVRVSDSLLPQIATDLAVTVGAASGVSLFVAGLLFDAVNIAVAALITVSLARERLAEKLAAGLFMLRALNCNTANVLLQLDITLLDRIVWNHAIGVGVGLALLSAGFLRAVRELETHRASLEQDIAAVREFRPDLAIGTTPVVQAAKQAAIPALYFTNLISARPLMGPMGAGSPRPWSSAWSC